VQITIIQAEIEEAIRSWIGSRLKVAEGMETTIELLATRGAEGFKAIIDINPAADMPTQTATGINMATNSQRIVPARSEAEAAQQVAEVAQAATTVSSIFGGANRPVRTAQDVREMMAAEAAAEEKTDTVEAPFDTAVASENVPVTEASDTNEDEAPAQSPPPSTAKSLFKGLRKPTNS
jgi:hypothetical protein